MIFVFGAARSGSTWLGKILDSHPDLLYLHEPDIPDRGNDLLPHWFERALTEEDKRHASAYLDRLANGRNLRAVGTRPFFRKQYRGVVAETARRALIYGAKAAERAGLPVTKVEIPDWASGSRPPSIAIKSVSALGRAEALLAGAAGTMRPILLVRHPCGYVSSMMRGQKMGVMSKPPGLGRLANTPAARKLGLDANAIRSGDGVTLLAWTWLLSNVVAHSAIEAAGGTVLVYEDLTGDPEAQMRSLFDRLDLGWPRQTAGFLRRSREHDGSYYSVFRDPQEASNRWRSELDNDVVDRVGEIVSRAPLGAQFFSDRGAQPERVTLSRSRPS